MILVTDIYQLTNIFPKEEIYGLTSQIRRCAVSIPSNIILLKDTEEMATRII
ncbi:four helix bundle protein [Flavobacterium sp. CECT 9288]|uniref:four helix bundle protein n=1 Tax=Flavobacterium sp. CECT 9288 TaxID=2845819 RepID=UPI00351CFE5E